MEEFELEPGEQITMMVRRHWIVLVGSFIPYVILFILPLFFPLVFSLAQHANVSESASVLQDITAAAPWLRMFLALWWLFIWITMYTLFTRYYLTVWVITNTRIVDIRQHGFFSRQVSSFLLSRVQDVTTDIEGVFATVFGFGTLNVETAGREEKFQMNMIEKPEALRDLIMREIAALNVGTNPTQTGI